MDQERHYSAHTRGRIFSFLDFVKIRFNTLELLADGMLGRVKTFALEEDCR